MYSTAPKEVIEARPAAIRFSKEIGAFANKKWKSGAQMASIIGSITFQNIIISVVVSLHPPGSSEGEAMIERIYEGSKKDALTRWHEADLKHHRKQGNI